VTSRSTFIETRNGGRFFPLDPRVEDVDLMDITHALSQQCRFSGHTRAFYSVAQHSVLVSRLLRKWGYSLEVQLWGLVHDASEAYLIDLPSPLKRDPRFAFYLDAESEVMEVICQALDLPVEQPLAVKDADSVLLSTEVRDLMTPTSGNWAQLTHAPMEALIEPWSSDVARKVFLSVLHSL
jgi:hypothetical protein